MNTIESIKAEMDRYFSQVTAEQLRRDMDRSNFDHFNQIGREIYTEDLFADLTVPATPHEETCYSEPVSSSVSAGNNEEMLMAA